VVTPLLRVGIAGLGQAGAMLVPAVLRHPHAAITAVADLRPDVRDAFVRDVPAQAYADIEALCAGADVDLVYIATPTELHAQHALLAAAHGKHVIVEKPMALSLADAAAMIAAAERHGVHLIVGHSQSFEPPIRAMRDVVREGALGRLQMLHTWYYTDWLYRPRTAAELDSARGGGVVFRQGAHQADLLRWIGGGLVRSVRAATGAWDSARPTEGAHVLFLDFEDGAVATAVFSGYDHFRSTELTFGIDERGGEVAPGQHARARVALRQAGNPAAEAELKRALGYGQGRPASAGAPAQPSFYGLTIVSCERGDIRQSANGLYVYGDDARWEIALPPDQTGRDLLLAEAYEAVMRGRAPSHDGRWGMANLEVCLAALESPRTRTEVRLAHQVPTPE
jgi:phthalate 4,5-cis-dihydrodiol dehydrogenase